MIDHLMRLQECADLLGVSMSSVYRWARAKQPPLQDAMKVGSSFVIPYLKFCDTLGLRPEESPDDCSIGGEGGGSKQN